MVHLSLFLLAILLEICSANDVLYIPSPPTIVIQPSQSEQFYHVALTKGESIIPVILKCEAEGDPQPLYYWTKNGKRFDLDLVGERVTQLKGVGTLNFSHPQASDEGRYQCFAKNPYGVSLSNSVFLRKSVGEPVTQQPVRQYVSPANKLILRGDDLQLACIYGGMPIPTVKWYFTKKGPLPSERLGTPIKIGKILKITNISSDNEGIYQCIANNGVGSEQKYSVTVIVESLPYWNVSPTNTQAAEDENVRFECSASGIPPQNFTG
ncbi:neuroglian-like [Tachypleus tridentatus]|uniref:neuroglian-like n=1 Tax=Tachypleus tridentatus TaxID=6853 RepID=UPI003FD12406